MISKERLQELIYYKATIYELCDEEIFEIDFSKLIPNQFYDDGFNVYISGYKVFFEYKKLYEFESKQQAEWVSKMHTERPEYFRPPFELKDNEKYKFTTAKGGKMSISKFVRQSGDVEWWLSYVGTHRTFYSYTEAVEYARKLFIGEE